MNAGAAEGWRMMHYITVNFPHYKAAQHFVYVFFFPFLSGVQKTAGRGTTKSPSGRL